MADIEVENVLREIRERVRAEAAERAPLSSRAETAYDDGDAGEDGERVVRGDEGRAAVVPASGALARMEANLATTGRTWNRLPPLLSNRAGWVARLELWLKRKIKRALHWFTWEQVNFNSAVHHALRDATAALADYERRLADQTRRLGEHDAKLAALRAETDALHVEASATRAEVEAARAEAQVWRAEASSLRRAHGELRSLLEAESAGAAARLAEVERHVEAAGPRLEAEVARFHDALAAAVEQLREEGRALSDNLVQLRDEQRAHAEAAAAERREQVAGLRGELDERAERLREELRVSFRQLSLEAGEAAVTHERARRHVESRIEALEKVMRAED